jgi:hypothetical protein
MLNRTGLRRTFKIEQCKLADKEHAEELRQYSHTFHRKNVICVAKDLWSLPELIWLAILLHEVGHLFAGQRGGENAANKQIKTRYGITIYYRDSRYGSDLEWISPEDRKKAKMFLGLVA